MLYSEAFRAVAVVVVRILRLLEAEIGGAEISLVDAQLPQPGRRRSISRAFSSIAREALDDHVWVAAATETYSETCSE